MLLVLIRHGIAEEISINKDDRLRDLTQDGVKKFSCEVPGLLPLLPNQGKPEIWYSPANRTMQTAQILHMAIPGSIFKEMDFIAYNDFDGFVRNFKDSDLPEVLIIVGHEPGMSVWSRKISGCSIRFSKGSCAGFKIKDFDNVTGKLEFFVQPSALIRLGREVKYESGKGT